MCIYLNLMMVCSSKWESTINAALPLGSCEATFVSCSKTLSFVPYRIHGERPIKY